MDIRAYQKSDYTQGQNIVIYGAGIYGEIAFQCLRTWGIRHIALRIEMKT